jgi:hypothetical protein
VPEPDEHDGAVAPQIAEADLVSVLVGQDNVRQPVGPGRRIRSLSLGRDAEHGRNTNPIATLELPIARSGSLGRQRSGPGERDLLIRRVKALSWLSLAYMTAEGAIAVTAAILAGSVALLGFGLDSVVEAFASVIVIWRFTGSRRPSPDAERRAQRLVAVSFFLLAPYIAQDAVRTLIAGEHPRVSSLGIGLSISSIIVMPLLGRAKQRLGRRLGSRATTGEGMQNMLCAYLASGVLLSLALNATFGLWWIDCAVALGIAAIAINEGRLAWRGEGCCVTSPLPGSTRGGCADRFAAESVGEALSGESDDACCQVGAGGEKQDCCTGR